MWRKLVFYTLSLVNGCKEKKSKCVEQQNIDVYIFSGALRLITGGGLPLETSDFLENSNFEAIDISSLLNEQYQEFSSSMINVTSDCDLIPPFPNRMWGAVSTLGLVSTFSASMVFLMLWC